MHRPGSTSGGLLDGRDHFLGSVAQVFRGEDRQAGLLQYLFAEIDVGASRRTTSGTCRLTSRAAATTPSAMTSQRMIPPKMLTSIPSTFGSPRINLKAAATRSRVAPPPTSRKLAGLPPCNLMMSIVAMARPAPLTMQPILPSSLT